MTAQPGNRRHDSVPEVFIGIDGGGTGSRAILTDADGHPLAERAGGPLNPYALSAGAFEANLRALCRDLLTGADLGADTVVGVAAGLAGVRTPGERTPVLDLLSRVFARARHIRVTHDLDIALRGATSSGMGVVIVAGTGSAAYGRWQEREVIVGGWGQILGDEGSGCWMGLKAMQAVVRAEDGRGETTVLRGMILERLGLAAPRDLVSWSRTASKADIAALAETVLKAVGAGDRPAQEILDAGASEIARMACAAAHRLNGGREAMEVALAGGLFGQIGGGESLYFEACRSRIVKTVPGTCVIRPVDSAVRGAVRWAMDEDR